MGQGIPTQHPAVVLRSHYDHVRVLLAVAMIAIVGLTAATVTLATRSQTAARSTATGSPHALSAVERRWSAYDEAMRALTPEQRAALAAHYDSPTP